MTLLERNPYLVQRVRTRPEPTDAPGVVGLFRFDSMGSAEFSMGAVPAAIERAGIAADQMSIHRIVPLLGGELWYVGPEALLPGVADWVNALLAGHARTKEPTWMTYTIGIETRTHIFGNPDGWLVIDSEPPWSLWRAEALARAWLDALQQPLEAA